MTGKFFHRVAVSRWYNSQPGAEPPNGVLVCVTPHLPHHPLETEFILGAASDKSDRREGFASSPSIPLSPSVPPLTRTAHLCSKLGEKVGRRSDRQRLTALGGRAGAEITFIYRGSVARPLFRIEA